MAVNRFVFSLGDGIDSLTGAHRGRGIISYVGESNEKVAPKEENKVYSGETQYNVVLINNYSDLYCALDLNIGLTAPINPSNSISTEASLFKQAKLTNQTISLLVKGKNIDYIQLMPKEAHVDPIYIEELRKNPQVFAESHGDEYVSQVMYGKKIYALINFKNSSVEEILQYKQTLEARLNSNISGKIDAGYLLSKDIKNTVSNIHMEYSGVKLDPPGVASDIDALFAFLDAFNKAPVIGCPIGFVSEPYTTIISSPEAAALFENNIVMKSIITKFDHLYNRIRFVTPTLRTIYTGIIYFRLQQSNPELVDQIKNLLSSAHEYQRILEAIMLEISVNKFDLNYQFAVYAQLNAFIKQYAELILNLEFTTDEITRKLTAHIARISSREGDFCLNLPKGGTPICWDIIPDKKNPIDHFDLLLAKPGKLYTSYTTLFKNLVNGMEIKINVKPSDQLRIRTNCNENITVVASVCGLNAFDLSLPRSKTEWIPDKKPALPELPILTLLPNNSLFKNNSQVLTDQNASDNKKITCVIT